MKRKSSKCFFLIMRGAGLTFKFLPKSCGALLALTSLFIMFHLVFALFMSAKTAADTLTRAGKLRVYADNLSEDLVKELLALPEVKSAADYDKKRAEEFFRSYAQVEANLDSKFFPSFAELDIKDSCSSASCLDELSERAARIQGVSSVSYGKAWLTRFERGRHALLTLSALSAALFILCSAVLTYQTVGLNLYRYKLEAEVYSVLGATKAFVRVPFMVMAALFAFIASVISLVLGFVFIKAAVLPVLAAVWPHYRADSAFYPLFFTVFFTVLSALSGYLSAVRFAEARENS